MVIGEKYKKIAFKIGITTQKGVVAYIKEQISPGDNKAPVSPSTITRIKNGKAIDLNTIRMIETAFEVDEGFFIDNRNIPEESLGSNIEILDTQNSNIINDPNKDIPHISPISSYLNKPITLLCIFCLLLIFSSFYIISIDKNIDHTQRSTQNETNSPKSESIHESYLNPIQNKDSFEQDTTKYTSQHLSTINRVKKLNKHLMRRANIALSTPNGLRSDEFQYVFIQHLENFWPGISEKNIIPRDITDRNEVIYTRVPAGIDYIVDLNVMNKSNGFVLSIRIRTDNSAPEIFNEQIPYFMSNEDIYAKIKKASTILDNVLGNVIIFPRNLNLIAWLAGQSNLPRKELYNLPNHLYGNRIDIETQRIDYDIEATKVYDFSKIAIRGNFLFRQVYFFRK